MDWGEGRFRKADKEWWCCCRILSCCSFVLWWVCGPGRMGGGLPPTFAAGQGDATLRLPLPLELFCSCISCCIASRAVGRSAGVGRRHCSMRSDAAWGHSSGTRGMRRYPAEQAGERGGRGAAIALGRVGPWPLSLWLPAGSCRAAAASSRQPCARRPRPRVAVAPCLPTHLALAAPL